MRSPKVSGSLDTLLYRVICLWFAAGLFLVVPAMCKAQTSQQVKPAGAEPIPESAVPAILAAFDKYEVVGMPEGHGMEDDDHFILSLIRNHLPRGRFHPSLAPRAPGWVVWILLTFSRLRR